ncbi:hypothetical protein RPMA_18190 [Tardiphaga alba]|uniref:Uncharacterized protein n=1 Tax=Tardiphaga alba TaxID=340268 RepID=A0ABX8ADQ1_9BRAD|nr:hypothetical protein [Tardiphaga alba]QUS40548.1 hypothetical protein RPMA_18190 [Tardiphaga alba]
MTATATIAFKACEEITIVGAETECECSHCGRPLKVGVRLAGFGGVFGSDCLARASEKQKVGPYIQKLSGQSIKERGIIARKGAEYASRMYGWRVGDANFKLVLKSDLRSI